MDPKVTEILTQMAAWLRLLTSVAVRLRGAGRRHYREQHRLAPRAPRLRNDGAERRHYDSRCGRDDAGNFT